MLISLFNLGLVDNDALIIEHSSAAAASADGRWICPICYYTENSANAKECEVCNSANHMNSKVNEYAM